MRRTARRIAAAGAISLVAGFGAGVPGATAVTAEDAPVTALLALKTGAASSVTLLDADGTPVSTEEPQPLSELSACGLGTSGDLLGFDSIPDDFGPGLKDGRIGVRESATATGTSCAAVDSSASESLVLTINAQSGGHGFLATSASLDLSLKQGAVVTATAALGSQTEDFTLECGVTADCGPDSGTNDHVRWDISDSTDDVVFDTLTLTAESGSFSLSGGADGVVSSTGIVGYEGASVFELVDAVGCGDTVDLPSSADVSSSTWQRLNSGDCTPYVYEASTGTAKGHTYAHFQKPLDVGTDGLVIWTTTVSYKGNKVPTPEFAFDPTPDATYDDLKRYWFDLTECDDSVVTISGNASAGYSATVDEEVLAGAPYYGNYACLVDTVAPPKTGIATFTAFVVGDAGMRF